MDGLEFTVKVRALRHLTMFPSLSHQRMPIMKQSKQVQGVQCDGFVVKPIDTHELIKRVEHLIRSHPVVLLTSRKTMDRLGPFQKILAGCSQNLQKARPCWEPSNSPSGIRSGWNAGCQLGRNAKAY
jgi:DNA-binding response OmpR family regulator